MIPLYLHSTTDKSLNVLFSLEILVKILILIQLHAAYSLFQIFLIQNFKKYEILL